MGFLNIRLWANNSLPNKPWYGHRSTALAQIRSHLFFYVPLTKPAMARKNAAQKSHERALNITVFTTPLGFQRLESNGLLEIGKTK